MTARFRVALAAALLILALISFFLGRRVEEATLAAQRRAAEAQTVSAAAIITPSEPTYRKLAVTEILALPFAEFYEALRSAPAEAREKWAGELEQMPAGPRRTAALAAFYKLLVQFDPVAAAQMAVEIEDKKGRELALDSVAGAAPGSALPDLAKIFLKIPADESDYRKYLENVVSEWVVIDPPAVAKFLDEHRGETEGVDRRELIKNWAALDPKATKKWIAVRGFGAGVEGDFFEGWYLHDKEAAVAYAVAHAEELKITTVLENALSALYKDSKEDAKKFIEQLPSDELRHKAFRGLRANFGTAEETGEADLTPRAVADWMTQFPPAYWRERLSDVLGYWSNAPPQEVFAWIEQQPAEIQDAVAAEYTPSSRDPVKTVTAVLQFARPDLRDRLLAAMFHNLSSSAWQMIEEIKNSSLPVEQKQHVLGIAAKVEADERAAREERDRAEDDQGSEK